MLVVGLLLPFVPVVVWATAATWRFPALLPQRYSDRALRILTDPGSDVLQGLVTSATIAVDGGGARVADRAVAPAGRWACTRSAASGSCSSSCSPR